MDYSILLARFSFSNFQLNAGIDSLPITTDASEANTKPTQLSCKTVRMIRAQSSYHQVH